MFTTRDELRQSLLEAGLTSMRATVLADSAKSCARIETVSVATDDELPLGATKIGGRPDLPKGTQWPYREPYSDANERIAENEKMIRNLEAYPEDDPELATMTREMKANLRARGARAAERRPLSFVAQINLAEVWAVAPEIDAELPKSGRLSLFYDADQQPWGFKPADHPGMQLIFDNSPVDNLTRMDAPTNAEQFDPLSCLAKPAIAPVPLWGHDYSITDADDPDHDRFSRWLEIIDEQDVDCFHENQVSGQPNQSQGDMHLECQLVSHGIHLGNPEGYHTERARELEAGAKDWLLLMQIASSDDSGMMWGDNGKIYVWITRDNLRARRFDQARLILQCS